MSERAPRRRARRWNAARARQEIIAYRESGLSQRAFCLERGVSLSRLRYWLAQLETEPTPASKMGALVAVSLKPVEVQPSPQNPPIEVEVEGGYVLRIPTGFDAKSLRAIIAVLKGAVGC